MKEVHAISVIALIYSIIFALITWVFFPNYLTWAVLGSATALFNHSTMVRVMKGKFNTQKYVFHLFLRYVMYLLAAAFTWLRTKDISADVLMFSLLFLLIGFLSIKISIYIHQLTPIRRLFKEEDIHNDTSHP